MRQDATNTTPYFPRSGRPNRAFGYFMLSIKVKIGSLVYQRALAISAAIDALAAELTGQHDYFHTLGAQPSSAARRGSGPLGASQALFLRMTLLAKRKGAFSLSIPE